MRIGVLALQGDFAKHRAMLSSIGVETVEVRQPQDLMSCDGLIIPGGESTTMLRQVEWTKLDTSLQDFARKKPIFGTCAGMILMSKHIENSQGTPFGWMDITVQRNGFGRQVESFQASVMLHLDLHSSQEFSAFFIRAPRVKKIGPSVATLGSHLGEPILLRQGHFLAASFHPELTSDTSLHAYFVQMVHSSIVWL